MARKTAARQPAVVVLFGDETYQKTAALQESIDALLPPEIDRTTALTTYDGTRSPDQGGPSLAAVLDDLQTLPFLSPLRVVVVRDGERFVSDHREALERYLASPAPTGVLVLELKSFPKTTRLYKAAAAVGRMRECRKLYGRELSDFVSGEARQRGKRFEPDAAARLLDLVGPDQGLLASEVEKLSLYAADRPAITTDDVNALVGNTREERIFAAMDAAASGRLPKALGLWQQVLATDPAAVFRALGGVAFVVRRWLAAQQMRAGGMSPHAIAPKVMMYGRGAELETLLDRLPAVRLRAFLARISLLDSQAKTGSRSIETGIEELLIELAAPSA